MNQINNLLGKTDMKPKEKKEEKVNDSQEMIFMV